LFEISSSQCLLIILYNFLINQFKSKRKG
jgi:hypothetical protein